MSGSAFLGIDLGGTNIKAVVLDGDGRAVWRGHRATLAHEGREAVMDRLLAVVQSARALSAASFAGVALGVPAVFDAAAGTIETLPAFTRDWVGFPLRDAFAERAGVSVSLLNDARAATLAELCYGAGRGLTDFINVTIGTGVGGGLVLNGELYLGSRGAAGEIGHQTVEPEGRLCGCGNRGCVETVAGAPALTLATLAAIEDGDLELAELIGGLEPTPDSIVDAARRGSAGAVAVYRRAGRAVGQALANLVCVLNPQAIVVGGGIAAAGDLLLDPMREEIARRTVVFSDERGGVRVVPSPLAGEAGAMGAAAWAMKQAAQTGRDGRNV